MRSCWLSSPPRSTTTRYARTTVGVGATTDSPCRRGAIVLMQSLDMVWRCGCGAQRYKVHQKMQNYERGVADLNEAISIDPKFTTVRATRGVRTRYVVPRVSGYWCSDGLAAWAPAGLPTAREHAGAAWRLCGSGDRLPNGVEVRAPTSQRARCRPTCSPTAPAGVVVVVVCARCVCARLDPKKKDAQKRLPDADKCASHVQHARRQIQARNFKDAVLHLTEAIDVRPRVVVSCRPLGIAAVGACHGLHAVTLSFVYWPQKTRAGLSPVLLLLRAEANIGQGHYEEAIADSGKVLKKQKNNMQAYLVRSPWCRSTRCLRGYRPHGVGAHAESGVQTRGQAHYMLGEHDMAKRHAQEGLRMDPEHAGCKVRSVLWRVWPLYLHPLTT